MLNPITSKEFAAVSVATKVNASSVRVEEVDASKKPLLLSLTTVKMAARSPSPRVAEASGI